MSHISFLKRFLDLRGPFQVFSVLFYRLQLNKIGALEKVDRFLFYLKKQDPTKSQLKFIKSLSFFKTKIKTDRIILVQGTDDHSQCIKLAAIAKVLSEKRNARIDIYNLNLYGSLGLRSKFQMMYKKYFRTSVEMMYLSFGNKIVFDNEAKYHDQEKIKLVLRKFKDSVVSADEVIAIKFEDCYVGDLIYDTYLRYYDVPTLVKVNDELFKVIEIGLNIYYNFKEFLIQNKVSCLVNTYSAYLQHGMLVRMCVQKKIDVYFSGYYSFVVQKLNREFPYHAIDHRTFDPNKVVPHDDRQNIIKILKNRFEGKVDNALSYMKSSSFEKGDIPSSLANAFAKRKRNVVIYAHEFVDTPHENRKLQFSDLYQHLRECLLAMKDEVDVSVFIKIHPNAFLNSKIETVKLVESFNQEHFILCDSDVSNLHIISLKPDIIATVWGTVGLEMAYHGLPVITMYDCLYNNFDFVHTCYSTSEYFNILKGKEAPKIIFDKEQIYSLYYQRNIERLFQGKHVWNEITETGISENTDEYLDKCEELRIPEKYQDLVDGVKEMIRIEDEEERESFEKERLL